MPPSTPLTRRFRTSPRQLGVSGGLLAVAASGLSPPSGRRLVGHTSGLLGGHS
jgi:hypothetical protein